MSNSGLIKKQNLIKEHYHELKKLTAQKNSLTKRINQVKERFEELIEVEADLDQLVLFENIDEYFREVSPENVEGKINP